MGKDPCILPQVSPQGLFQNGIAAMLTIAPTREGGQLSFTFVRSDLRRFDAVVRRRNALRGYGFEFVDSTAVQSESFPAKAASLSNHHRWDGLISIDPVLDPVLEAGRSGRQRAERMKPSMRSALDESCDPRGLILTGRP
jgi:hypothetical protein